MRVSLDIIFRFAFMPLTGILAARSFFRGLKVILRTPAQGGSLPPSGNPPVPLQGAQRVSFAPERRVCWKAGCSYREVSPIGLCQKHLREERELTERLREETA